MPSPLSILPVEVIEIIASSLDRKELFSARLISKDFNRKTLHYFGRTYFTVLQTNLSHDSLQKLQSISRVEQLKHHVQSLLIKNYNDDLGRGVHWHQVKESNSFGHVDTRISPGVKMLLGILSNLTNCKSFGIHSPGGVKEHHGSEYLLASDAIGIILSIVAEIGLPVKSFCIDLWRRGIVDVKRLQMQLFQQPAFITSWKNLKELRLQYTLTPDSFDWAQDLVLHTTSLKKLSLHFDFDYSTPFLNGLLSSPIPFQGLQEFNLACVIVTIDTLSTLLFHCRSSLRMLSFRYVCIKSGTWVQILKELRNFPHLEKIVVNGPKEAGDELVHKKFIHIQFPALDKNLVVPGSQGRKFELEHSKWGGQGSVLSASYQGRVGMDEALKILAESAEYF